MTIAISVKVNDGLVLATDSASTLVAQEADGKQGVVNVYNNANKLFNLKKGHPIGIITWGAGSMGLSSISTIIKDYRKTLELKENYTIEEIANHFNKFICDLYEKEFNTWLLKPLIGFTIAGYSSGSIHSEEWQINIVNGKCSGPLLLRKKEECGINWSGEPEPIFRLVKGYSQNIFKILEMAQIPEPKILELATTLLPKLEAPITSPAMPIQDAIDLTEFLVNLTINYSRFMPGAQTVGGPVEIATITRHEGFKWIRRKHYFDVKLNMREDAYL
ncbi:MAG: hypothetical protein PHW04_12890 [Candidatus Wallbacteria bacterium]|nr:hypothetical protein [Candidatus Wallbacteria bacterium]